MPQKLSRDDWNTLMRIASDSVYAAAHRRRPEPLQLELLPETLRQNGAVFVTLTKSGELRGCIGTILPVSPLVEAVAANARAAAFEDPRFEPVDETEFADLHIEISLLSVPERLDFTGRPDLESRLAASHPGVILQLGVRQATFLPQVWDELPDASDFLEALCHKAGLPADSLNRPELVVFTYTVEAFEEPDE